MQSKGKSCAKMRVSNLARLAPEKTIARGATTGQSVTLLRAKSQKAGLLLWARLLCGLFHQG